MTDLYISLEKTKYPQLNIAFKSNIDFKGLNFRVVTDTERPIHIFLTSDDRQKIYTISNLNIYTSINESGSLTGTFTTHIRDLKFKNCSISSKSVNMEYIKHDPLDVVDKDNNVTINSDNFTFNIVPRYKDSRSILPSIFNKDRRDYIIDKIENDFLKDYDHHRKSTSEDVQSFLDDIKGHIDPNFWKRAGINVNSPDINIELSYMGYYGDEFIMLFYNKKPQSDFIGPDIMKTKIDTKVNGIGNMSVGVLVQ